VTKLPEYKRRFGPSTARLIWTNNPKKDYSFKKPCKGFSIYSFKRKYSVPSNRWTQTHGRSIYKLSQFRAVPERELSTKHSDFNRSMRSFVRSSGLEGLFYSDIKDRFCCQLRFLCNCIFFMDCIPFRIIKYLQHAAKLYLSFCEKWVNILARVRSCFNTYLSRDLPLLFRSVTFLRASGKHQLGTGFARTCQVP